MLYRTQIANPQCNALFICSPQRNRTLIIYFLGFEAPRTGIQYQIVEFKNSRQVIAQFEPPAFALLWDFPTLLFFSPFIILVACRFSSQCLLLVVIKNHTPKVPEDHGAMNKVDDPKFLSSVKIKVFTATNWHNYLLQRILM